MENELAKTIGSAVRVARVARQLTQQDAAEVVGVSSEFYARIERGKTLPSVPTLAKLTSALGVSADTLLGRRPGQLQGLKETRLAVPDRENRPEMHRIVRRLRRASPKKLRLVAQFLALLDVAAR